MRLSLHTDHALRVLMLLAAEPGATIAAPELADRWGISVHHVRKIVQDLAALGVVKTARGRGGGVALARPPEHIDLGQVVRALEDLDLLECFNPDRDTCRLTPACRLRGALREATEAFLARLDGVSLRDVAPSGAVARALLRAPAR